MFGDKCIRADGAITEHSFISVCNWVHKVELSGDGRCESIFEVRTVKAQHLCKTPNGVDKDNVDWEILKPLCVLSTACKDWCETIRDFLANGRRWKLLP